MTWLRSGRGGLFLLAVTLSVQAYVVVRDFHLE